MNQKSLLHKIFPFLTWMQLITKDTMKDDLRAGLTGMIIVIPQAVAFASIAGLPPIYGFYTAMITPVIAALFGSSYHLISGPTTAISIVVFATISKFANPETELLLYVELTLILTVMAGIIQFLLGLFRTGKLVNFVSHSVIIGFTAGAGILIAVKQLKHVFGIKVPQGSGMLEIIEHIWTNFNQTNWFVFYVASGTLVSALIIKRFLPKYYMLLAMIIGSILAIFLGGDARGIELVGDIPSTPPQFRMPGFSMEKISQLMNGAFIVAILGLIEAVAIAKSIALRSHQKIDANQEFIGQGLSNMIAGFFNSYAGSGSFTRSGVNQQAGARTPMSGIFAALFLLIVLIFFGTYASYLPKPAMGGIILLVGYNLIDFHHIKKVIKSCGFPTKFPRSWSDFLEFFKGREFNVFLVTMLGTMFFHELEYALILGIFLSFIYYFERTSQPYIATMGKNKHDRFVNIIRDDSAIESNNIKVIRIDGSLYFGAIECVSEFFAELYKTDYQNVLIISHGINFIDLTGAEWLENEAAKWKAKGGGLYFCNMSKVAQNIIVNANVKATIGEDHFFKTKYAAVKAIPRLVY